MPEDLSSKIAAGKAKLETELKVYEELLGQSEANHEHLFSLALSGCH